VTGAARPAREVDGTAHEDLRSATAAGGEDAPALVESALQLRWRAPELALLLADQAGGATGDVITDLLAAASLNRLGREVEAGQRALAGLRRAGSDESNRDLRCELRVELAAGAVAVGGVGAAMALLRPVLEAESGAVPSVRATALVQLAVVLTVLERHDGAARALQEADDLYRGDAELEPIPAVLLRGTVRALRSSHHRRHGELAAAESAARDGLELLSELSSPAHDGGAIGARLVLELVLALLDRGEPRAAARAAATVVGSSVRAAAAPSRGWLHLALATRVHLPAGRHREALGLLGDAVDAAERHLLHPVLAECLGGLCRIHEERGEHAEALRCLRSAHAAEYRQRRAADALRIELIEEYGTGRRDVAGLAEQLIGLIGTGRDRRRHEPPTAADRAVALVPPVHLIPAADPVAVGLSHADGTEPTDQDLGPAAGAGQGRHRSDGGQQRPVAELLSAAGHTGRGTRGRRRAEDRAVPATPSALVDEPPLGSRQVVDKPAAGDRDVVERSWSPPEGVQTPTLVDRIAADSSHDVGLGDLLAAALAAFEEGRRS
jgi:tetratricopeptide (TPR) repeat protein